MRWTVIWRSCRCWACRCIGTLNGCRAGRTSPRQIEQKWHPPETRWMALLPGGRWDNKRWPVANFVDLVKLLRQTPDTRFVILGSKDEQSAGRGHRRSRPRSLAEPGRPDFADRNDRMDSPQPRWSSPTTPARCTWRRPLGRPVIALFGPTNPRNTGPYGQLNNVLQNTDCPASRA